MLFRQLIDFATNTYTYLIADTVTRRSIIIDPVLENVDSYRQLLKELRLTLSYTFETHIHADHITGAAMLREKTGCQACVPEHAGVQNADHYISDHQTTNMGNIIIKAIHTPGHTNADMSYVINHDRILAGDTLLIRGCGRTDLQGGNAEALYKSIHERIFTLPETMLVFPGHDYHGNTCSTIGEERRWNPRLGENKSLTDFIAMMAKLNLAKPKNIDIAVPANQQCGVN